MRSRPHEGTGVCSAIALTGVSAMAVMPEVSDRVRATDAGTTNVVAALETPMTDGAAPSVASSSEAIAEARVASTDNITYSSVRSKGTGVTKSTGFSSLSSATEEATLLSLLKVSDEPVPMRTPAVATSATAAATPIHEGTRRTLGDCCIFLRWRLRAIALGACDSDVPHCLRASVRPESGLLLLFSTTTTAPEVSMSSRGSTNILTRA